MNEGLEFYTKNEKGEYEVVGREFTGWPSNGTWLVKDGKQCCIIPIHGIPEMPSPSLVSYMKFQDELSEYLQEEWNDKGRISLMNISKAACEFFAIKAGGIKIKDEIVEN